LELRVIELKSAVQAQKAPSLYGVFNLIYDGKLEKRYNEIWRR